MKKHIGLIIFIVIIAVLVVLALLPNDEDKYLKDITVNEIVDKIDKKDDFILYVKQTDCEHCKTFTPRFASVLKDYKQDAYVLNITDLSDEDSKTFGKLIEVDGTPTVLFYKNGEKSMITIEGEQTVDNIKSKMKSAGFPVEKNK